MYCVEVRCRKDREPRRSGVWGRRRMGKSRFAIRRASDTAEWCHSRWCRGMRLKDVERWDIKNAPENIRRDVAGEGFEPTTSGL